MKHDPHDRIELTGPWAGFGFQGGHMWTPEGHTLYPEDMRWWSLTCNIAREWRLMMEIARAGDVDGEAAGKPCGTSGSKVVFLQDVLRRRQERRPAGDGARFAGARPVDQDRRGPRPPRRG